MEDSSSYLKIFLLGKLVKKILLIISSLSPGGAERVLATMANYWDHQSVDVNILTFDDGSIGPFYELNSGINHTTLNALGFSANFGMGIIHNLKRIKTLRKTVRSINPDVVISYIDQTNILVLLATVGLSPPVIVTEHSNPFMAPIGSMWQKLRNWTYPRAGQVVVLNSNSKEFFPLKIQRRTTIIPNPVLVEEPRKDFEKTWTGSSVLAMGRFSKEKGFDILLQAFARIVDRYPDWELHFLGEGPLLEEMKSLKERLGLSSKVKFWGALRHPHDFLRNCDLFVLSSHIEGFPMALCEAMACGLPVISTEYHEGVRDIVSEGINGLLVPPEDIDALTQALDRLMGDAYERKRLGGRGVEIVEQYGLKIIMDRWDDLIEKVVKNT
jgi:GalNAc-alpha-(1->4)-GalNAc-alpha-(1->3)-diNAcBac-PP-undecaprenol alpha-1,4-N-acetyl-D-galactosaminyltransferase